MVRSKNKRGREEGQVSTWEGDGKQTWGWALPGFWPSPLGGCQERARGGGRKRETLLNWVFEMAGIPALCSLLWICKKVIHHLIVAWATQVTGGKSRIRILSLGIQVRALAAPFFYVSDDLNCCVWLWLSPMRSLPLVGVDFGSFLDPSVCKCLPTKRSQS